MAINNNWQAWCRLCAATNDTFSKMDTINELSTLVKKYFLITPTEYDEKPSFICNACVKFVFNIEQFAIRCSKVDQLYDELIYEHLNNSSTHCIDIISLRRKHGLPLLHEPSTQLAEGDREKIFDDCDVAATPSLNTVIEEDEQYIKQEINDASLLLEIVEQNHQTLVTPTPSPPPLTKKRVGRPRKTAPILKPTYVDPDATSSDDESDEDRNNFDKNNQDDNGSIECSDDDRSMKKLNPSKSSHKKKGKIKAAKKVKEAKPAKDPAENRFCKICGCSFQRYHQYHYHMRTKHSDKPPIESQFECPQCQKYFSNKNSLRTHQLCHLPESEKNIYSCPSCEKTFTSKNGVKIHIRVAHIGDRPFICEECGNSYCTQGALKEHQNSHTDERPFPCQFCSKRFKKAKTLKIHEEIHSEIHYECTHCGLRLKTKMTLRNHMLVHTEAKNFKCNFCGNEYKRSKTLKKHLILHTGQQPYKCPFCEKTFADGSNCRSHKKKYHPQELAAFEAAAEQMQMINNSGSGGVSNNN